MKAFNPILINLFLLVVCSFFISSCCTRRACVAFGFDQIELLNFSSKEVDSITIRTFKSKSNVLVDSFSKKGQTVGYGDSVLVLYLPVSVDMDYKITFNKLNKTYFISDITTTERDCNACFPFGHDSYTTLGTFALDGQVQNYFAIQIKK